MIDKLDLRIPAGAPYTRELSRVLKDAPRRPDPHYLETVDLRPYGYQSVLHSSLRHGDRCCCTPTRTRGCTCGKSGGTSKLEIIDTGKLPYAAMVHEVERVFDIDARPAGVLRIDLCADVPDVPVSWFAQHARVLFKRQGRAIGTVDMQRVASSANGIETLYYGKKPCQLRIYNKVAEWRHEYLVRRRGATPREKAEWPDFETAYGVPEDAILTRVERQIGGGAPELARDGGELATMWRLKANLECFDPFERLELVQAGKKEPNISSGGRNSLVKYAAGMYFRHLLEDEGWTLHELRGWIHRHSKRNAARILRDYAEFLPSEWRVSVGRITEIYQRSVYRQLAA